MEKISKKTESLLGMLGLSTDQAMDILLNCIVYSDPTLIKELESVEGLDRGYLTFSDSLKKLGVLDLINGKSLTTQQMKEMLVGMYLLGLSDSTGFGLAHTEANLGPETNSLTELLD